MDRNTLVGFVLLALLTVGYVMYTNNEQKKYEAYRLEQQKKEAAKMTADSSVTSADSAKKEVANIPPKPTVPANFSVLAEGEERLTIVETDDCIYTFSNKGATLYSVELKKYKTYNKGPLILFKGNENQFYLTLPSIGGKVTTDKLYFTTDASNATIKGEEELVVSFKAALENGAEYIHEYKLKGSGYLLDFKVKVRNMSGVLSSEDLTINWKQRMPSLESNVKEEQMYSNLYYRTADKYVEELSSRKAETKVTEQPVQWVSFKQKFFNNTLIAEGEMFESGSKMNIQPEEGNSNYVKDAGAVLKVSLPDMDNATVSMRWHFGPNQYNQLRKMKIGLEEVIPLGWAIFGWVNRFMIIPIFNFLDNFIPNYGIIILLLTLLIKIVLSPLNQKQMVSAAKMQILRPEIEQLKKKYGDDKQMIGVKQMELFRSAGVNPVGGCLPILLQMPILFAMYRFFPNSIELRQQSFLWADDLSHYDSIFTLPFTIPLYGDHVSLFTLLMAITSFLYTKYTMSQQTATVTDDMMAMQMKIMQYITPFMFLVMFNSFSAALSYYYFLFNLMSIVQTVVLKKFFINEDALREEIEANKKKPKKKSAWQERLDQMMQQQQAAQQQKHGNKKK
jgi:YidC/Oxa1 family membrane protein insertase